MRNLLPLALLLISASWLAGSVIADEDALTYRTFDVSAIIIPEEGRAGPHLGMLPPHTSPPEPNELLTTSLVPAKKLVELLRTSVEPGAWDRKGAFLELRGTLLHVRQQKAVVTKLEAFLFELAAQARLSALCSLDVLEGDAGAYPASVETARVGASGAVEAPLGVRRFLAATNQRQYVADYEVEIAQGSNISNPVVQYPLEGLVTDVLVLPTRDASRLVVEAFIQQGRYRDGHTRTLGVDEESIARPFRSEPNRFPLGILECPEFEHVGAYVTALASPGQVLTIPVARNGRQQTFRLRVEPRGAASAGPILSIAALTRPSMGVRLDDYPEFHLEWTQPPQVWFDHNEEPFVHVEPLLHLTQQVVDPEAWESGDARLRSHGNHALILHAPAAHRGRVEAFLRARESELLRPVVLDTRVYSVAAPVASGASREVDPAAARLLAAARLPTLIGRRTGVMAGSTQNFIADYDVEVAQEARISDPNMAQAFDGLVVSLLPRASLDGRLLATEVRVVYAVRTLEKEPFEPGAQTLGPIDRVRVERVVVDSTFHIPAKGTYVIDGGRDPRDPKRRLAIEIRASVP